MPARRWLRSLLFPLHGRHRQGLSGRGIEQTDEELYPEDVAHTVVNDFFAQSAFLHQFAEGKDEGVGRAEGTAYVQPGFHALADGFFHVFGGAVLGVEVFYGVTVGYDVATESHFATQAGGEPVVAALHGMPS